MKKFYLILYLLVVGFGLHGYSATIYVSESAKGNNTGINWDNAYTLLQSALDAAVTGDQIWVARGTYKPSSSYGLTNTQRYYHFEMKEGVAIYGGFVGTEITTTDRTSFGVGQTNETILSGDVGKAGTTTDNCCHVIYNPATLALTNAAIIDGFTITGGYAYTSPTYYGGGMYNCSSSPTLVNINFISNLAVFGGAIGNLNSSPVIINSAIISNSAGHGAGMYNVSSSPTLTNVTIASNTAAGNGGGIYNRTSYPVFNNSILFGNLAANANQLYNESGTITLNYSCYANGTGDITNSGTLMVTNNNITTNPLFYNAMGNDFRLTANSPCLDAGNDSYNSKVFDIRGKGYSRKLLKSNASVSGAIDMGAYEYLSGECTIKRIYVNTLASGSNSGTSWNNAYTSLQTAIINANFGDVIWVAKGTYKPSSAYSLTNASRYYHFEMKEGVAIYGGFVGTETAAGERTTFGYGEANETILSGDIGTVGSSIDNCYHVIYNPSKLSTLAILDGFTITGGNANDLTHCYGGGMCNNSNASPTVNNATFISNYANNGGGMFNYINSSPVLNNVSFISNSAKFGAGMYNWKNSSPVLVNAKFFSNTALVQGGALSNFAGSLVTITNGIIALNMAETGGGIYCESNAPLMLTNVTIASNIATSEGGGIYCNSSATLNNCIIWGNTSEKTWPDMFITTGNTVIMNYSCYSTKLYDIGSMGTFTTSNHNITTNPVFADATNGDFRIKKVSPCVNAGYDIYNSLTTDIRGTGYDRKIGTVDMGAYEYNSSSDADVDVVMLYVNASSTGSNDGTSWANAYISLQTALENANAGDHIWVAKGTYKPSSAYDLTNESRFYHFRMKADVAIYGGFSGSEARDYDLLLRDFTTNETILSGDLGTSEYYPDNCYHVIYNPNSSALVQTAVLDGFTVTGGDANGSVPHRYGAGMYNNTCSPTISNVKFIGNTAVLSDATGCGAGMYNEKSSPKLTNVAFTSNQATVGGGMYNTQSSPVLVNVSFTANRSAYAGGGLYSYNGSSVTLTNCTFIQNFACSHGGGMYHYGGTSPILTNVTFNLNQAEKGGGAYFIDNLPVLNNCIIWDNIATNSGNEIYVSDGTATLNYSCYSNDDNDIYAGPGGSFTIDGNSITTDPKFIDASKADCHIGDNSPCIDKGNNAYNTISTDIGGRQRIQNTTIDMGAYEWTNGVDFICTNPTDGGVISSDQIICNGSTPKAFESTTAPTGYTSTLEYQWQSSTTSQTEGFINIVSANAEVYASGKLALTTWFKRLARAKCMNDWTGAAESNVITVEVVSVTNPDLAIETTIYTYDGTLKTAVLNVAEGEIVEWLNNDWDIIPNLSGTDAGTYSATAQIVNIKHRCYSSDIAFVDLVINKADLTVTSDASQSKVFGNPDPVLTYSYTPELATADSFTGVLIREDGEDAGDYDITKGTLSAGENYSITFVGDDFTIKQKPITLIPDANQSKVYGEPDPAFTYAVTPALSGDDELAGALTRTEGEDVGTYAFSIGSLSAGDNYSITFVDADFAITKKPITVTPNATLSKVYGEADPELIYSSNPVLVGDDTFNGSLTRDAAEDTGIYSINIGTLNAGDNYSVSLTDADFTITAKPVTVTADAMQSKIYGDADPALSYTIEPNLIAGDSFTGALSRVMGEDVGQYSIETGTLSAGSNYTISLISSDFEIRARQLTISDPVLTTAKQYDGTTTAAITFGTISGVIPSDESNVNITATANYDNASVGAGKTITVIYTLDGSASGNYLVPSGFITNTAVICEKITISEIQPLESGCEGGALDVSYNILSGEPVEYQILFGGASIASGFTNIGYNTMPTSFGTGVITFSVPEGLAYGIYSAQLQLRNSIGAESELYPFSFTINLSSDYLVDKFYDVVLCDNSSEFFTAYQWYKNGVLISGATNQFYNDPSGLSGAYYVKVITIGGETLQTCPATYNKVAVPQAAMSIYPNPGVPGQSFTVEVTGLEQEDLKGAMLRVYNIQGSEVYNSKQVNIQNNLNLYDQLGNFIIRINTVKGKVLNGKITIMK